MKILIIDNYDSYTYNLYQAFAELTKEEPLIIKNDELTWEELNELDFDAVVISPGPGTPENTADFGICSRVIKEMKKPILGICLGHQGIYHVFGGKVDRAPVAMHGELSPILHKEKGLFEGIETGTEVVRYHSLACVGEVPSVLAIEALTEDEVIMALSHKERPIWGVQFHPESISTKDGKKLLANFLKLAEDYIKEHESFQSLKKDCDLDAKDLFAVLDEKYKTLQWLDSSLLFDDARFSIFGLTGPKGALISYDVERKQLTESFVGGETKRYNESLFHYLRRQKKYPVKKELPFEFQLGYMGYFGYEMKADCVGTNKKYYAYPDAALYFIDRALVMDHKEKSIYILGFKTDTAWFEEAEAVLVECKEREKKKEEKVEEAEKEALPRLRFVRNREGYLEDIRQSQELIAAGESYEICLTNRLDIEAKLDPVKYYSFLREVSPAPYSALLRFPKLAIASSSMEKFLTLDREGMLRTKPIKGTIARGKTTEEDEALKEELSQGDKNRAENLMIVDLLRNDFGKICELGGVKVPKLMQVETYSTLHQLVTTIEGKLRASYTAVDALEACFPGGSMTGAPKKRTLEIIDRLEKVPRGVYSGCLGYLSRTGCMDFNIVIRTAVIEEEKASLGVGGAIIALSDPEEEFEEILLKAKGNLKCLKKYYGMKDEEEFEIEGA